MSISTTRTLSGGSPYRTHNSSPRLSRSRDLPGENLKITVKIFKIFSEALIVTADLESSALLDFNEDEYEDDEYEDEGKALMSFCDEEASQLDK